MHSFYKLFTIANALNAYVRLYKTKITFYETRTKEIGIRKVLGASVLEIVRLLSLNFAKTVIIAALIALPIAYVVMEQWLSNYFVRINLNAWIFIFAIVVILLLGAATVSFQTIKTAIANPSDSLKQE